MGSRVRHVILETLPPTFLSGKFIIGIVSIMAIFSTKNANDLESLIFLNNFFYPNVISKDISSIKTLQFYNLPWK